MALDFAQSAALRTNLIFRGRISSAALQWAGSIYGNTGLDVSHPDNRQKLEYAGNIYRNPDATAMSLQPLVVQDPAVQAQDINPDTGDSNITDPYLQSAVEASILKVI